MWQDQYKNLYNSQDHFNEIDMVYNKLHMIFNAPEITEGTNHIAIKDNGISVENIKFAYDDIEIIHGISFEAKAGTMTALVGLQVQENPHWQSLLQGSINHRKGL